MIRLRTAILPPPQSAFWAQDAGQVPGHFVLYGGTAIALRLGHRISVDFDFFTDRPFRYDDLVGALPALARAHVLQRARNTLLASLRMPSGEVKLSFFGGLSMGRVGEPDKPTGKPPIASPLDLLATKLKTLHDRIEAKDYLDIEALLRSGLGLDRGIAAARTLFGASLNPLDTAKAVAWFEDGGLKAALPAATRRFLTEAAADFDPSMRPLPLKSKTLGPTA